MYQEVCADGQWSEVIWRYPEQQLFIFSRRFYRSEFRAGCKQIMRLGPNTVFTWQQWRWWRRRLHWYSYRFLVRIAGSAGSPGFVCCQGLFTASLQCPGEFLRFFFPSIMNGRMVWCEVYRRQENRLGHHVIAFFLFFFFFFFPAFCSSSFLSSCVWDDCKKSRGKCFSFFCMSFSTPNSGREDQDFHLQSENCK